MKILIVFCLTLASGSVMAKTPFMSIKERLRLQLWHEGLEKTPQEPRYVRHYNKRYPEELDRALRKF